MTTPRTALDEWTELSENCTQGRFVARPDGLIIAECDDHSYEVGITPGWNRHDREFVVSAINLLRTHGKALSEALGAWLPISEAPQDGTRIMLLRGQNPVFGEWNPDKYANKPRPYWSHDQERLWGARDARETPPTHWRPLPPPPTSAKGSEVEGG